MRAANVSSTSVTLLATASSQSVLAEVDEVQLKSLAYTAHGLQSGEQAPGSRLGFNGQVKEQPQGWYHLGHGRRIYSPLLMRFHSPDLLSPFAGGGLNAYAYCLGDPVNLADPTGGQAEPIHYLSLITAGLSVFTGSFSLAMPWIIGKASPGSWLARYAERKPGISGPVGGLDAVMTVGAMVGGMVGAGATVLNMQQPQLPPSQELMYASMALGLFTMVTKAGIAYVPTSYPPGAKGRSLGNFVHGKKKIEKADEVVRRSESRSRSQTPGDGGGAEDIPMQPISRSSSSSGSVNWPAIPATPPNSPIASPRRINASRAHRLAALQAFARVLRTPAINV